MSNGRGLDVLVLAGGLGTRIRAVLGDVPKVLAPINGRPFLDHLLDSLKAQGARRVVLALGYLADKVIAHLAANPPPLPVDWVIETQPLGTAGALRHALPALQGDFVLVMNGDTWVDADLLEFQNAWQASGRAAAIMAVRVEDVSRYGSLDISDQGTLRRFVEKDPNRHGPGIINAGLYLFDRSVLADLQGMAGPSLERDVLACLPAGSVAVHLAERAAFVDIGTPDSLAGAAAVVVSDNQGRLK